MTSLLRFALLAIAFGAGPAIAQYPSKPIRLIVPFPAGGSADAAARIVAQPLSQALGQAIVIENKAGADGAIAGDAVARAVPDGYTLFFATNTAMNAAPVLHKATPYDPVADFTPVGRIGTFGFFVFVYDGLPVKTLAELIAYARANPGKLNYGTGNSTSILATGSLAQTARLDMVHVPYKGDAPLLADIITGRVQMTIATGVLLPQAKDGKLRVLATLLPNRSPLLADVPTLPEAGTAALPITPWAGLFGPAKLPREVLERLARELPKVLAQREVRDQLDLLAFEPQSSSPEELGVFMREQLGVWRVAVKEAGIPTD
jgi:tripartite-type tricarboxylate transporter receptor subunit TctC